MSGEGIQRERRKSGRGSCAPTVGPSRPHDANAQGRGLFDPQGVVSNQSLPSRNITYINTTSSSRNRCSHRTIEFSPKKQVSGGRRTRDFGRPGLAAFPPAPLRLRDDDGGPRQAVPPGAAYPAESGREGAGRSRLPSR
jgi:hypothetical protein